MPDLEATPSLFLRICSKYGKRVVKKREEVSSVFGIQ